MDDDVDGLPGPLGYTPRSRRRRSPKRVPGPSTPKTAVIVIHGMGEQWPMDTFLGFVDAAWRLDDDLNELWSQGETYSRPERISGSFELRRITTRYWKSIADRRRAAEARRFLRVLLGAPDAGEHVVLGHQLAHTALGA